MKFQTCGTAAMRKETRRSTDTVEELCKGLDGTQRSGTRGLVSLSEQKGDLHIQRTSKCCVLTVKTISGSLLLWAARSAVAGLLHRPKALHSNGQLISEAGAATMKSVIGSGCAKQMCETEALCELEVLQMHEYTCVDMDATAHAQANAYISACAYGVRHVHVHMHARLHAMSQTHACMQACACICAYSQSGDIYMTAGVPRS